MTGSSTRFSPADWRIIDLVVFDVDGTLYDQRRLRFRMALELLGDMVVSRSLEAGRVLREYRKIREELAEEERENFEGLLVRETSRKTRVTEEQVRHIVEEWIEHRPLRHVSEFRYPGVAAVFGGLRKNGKLIGVLSDYPASAKLQAMNIEADFVVSATDAEICRLKPHPKGLQELIRRAGVVPQRTLMIGDRCERDGAAAERAGARALIRASDNKSVASFASFAKFTDQLFESMLP